MNNKMLRSLLILVVGGVIGFGLSWWWCNRGHDKDDCKGKEKKECCNEKKECDDDEGVAWDCNKTIKYGDSGALTEWNNVESDMVKWNNNKPLSQPQKSLGGRIHTSVLEALLHSVGKKGGYVHYMFGIHNSDTMVYFVGGASNKCKQRMIAYATCFCPACCPKGVGGN